MWEITPKLFLGDRDDARDRALLSGRGITHVLNCAEDEACRFAKELEYLHLLIKDPDPRFGEFVDGPVTSSTAAGWAAAC